MLLGGDPFFFLLGLIQASTEPLVQLFPVFLQMEQPLQHFPPLRPFQRKKFRKLPLGQHNGPGEIRHGKPEHLLDLAVHILVLVRQNHLLAVPVVDDPAHGRGQRDLILAFKLAIHPVALRTVFS